MAFSVAITSVLSGATVDQLAYWRRPTAADAPLLVPETRRSGRYLYSWADVVALRSIVYLRSEKSLPRIRRAVETLRRLEADDWTHLSRYVLISSDRTIIVKTPNGDLLDVEAAPGTVVSEVLMADILLPFETANGRQVPAMERPRPHLQVSAHVLGGYPVVAGSRVPFHVVAGLADEGVEPRDIAAMYPSVPPAAVPDAQAFARQVAAAAA